MRRLIFAASCLALAGCDKPPEPGSPVVSTQAPAASIPATTPPSTKASVEGWDTNPVHYARLGATVPHFAVKEGPAPAKGKDTRKEITQDILRDKWTILAFPGPASKDEATFVTALNSAVDQDPDLDLLVVRPPGASADTLPGIQDDGKIAAAFRIDHTPAYLLIGPDLTIEGYREDLSKTPDDGIKSVIRGVAQIRKQIAAPE